MSPDIPQPVKDRTVALVGLIGATGATDVQIRYQDDDEPTVWVAVAAYGHGATGDDGPVYQVHAGLDPVAALYNLAERLIDGGRCTTCSKVTVLAALDRDEDEVVAGLVDSVFEGACTRTYTGGHFIRGCDGLVIV